MPFGSVDFSLSLSHSLTHTFASLSPLSHHWILFTLNGDRLFRSHRILSFVVRLRIRGNRCLNQMRIQTWGEREREREIYGRRSENGEPNDSLLFLSSYDEAKVFVKKKIHKLPNPSHDYWWKVKMNKCFRDFIHFEQIGAKACHVLLFRFRHSLPFRLLNHSIIHFFFFCFFLFSFFAICCSRCSFLFASFHP